MTDVFFISAIIVCAVTSYWAGLKAGRDQGSKATLIVLEGMGILTVDDEGTIKRKVREIEEDDNK